MISQLRLRRRALARTAGEVDSCLDLPVADGIGVIAVELLSFEEVLVVVLPESESVADDLGAGSGATVSLSHLAGLALAMLTG